MVCLAREYWTVTLLGKSVEETHSVCIIQRLFLSAAGNARPGCGRLHICNPGTGLSRRLASAPAVTLLASLKEASQRAHLCTSSSIFFYCLCSWFHVLKMSHIRQGPASPCLAVDRLVPKWCERKNNCCQFFVIQYQKILYDINLPLTHHLDE